MFKTLLLLAAIVAAGIVRTAGVQARTWQEGVEGEIDGMSYRYYLPADYDPSVEYPLLLFLHGSGESGTDNRRQVNVHIGGLINKTESEYPAIFVAPQLPQSSGWSPFQPIDNTFEMLTHLVDSYSVDTNRLYITGLSMGGFGSMEYAQYYNGEGISDFRFAAVAPLSGAFIDTRLPLVPEGLADTAFWLAHGSSDGAVNVNTSRNTFRVLAGLDPTDAIPFDETLLRGPTAIVDNVRYTELPRQGHVIWSPIYNSNTFYDWMFAQSRAVPEPHSIVLAAGAAAICLLQRRRA